MYRPTTMEGTFQAPDGYDYTGKRKGNKGLVRMLTVRAMTLDEIKALSGHATIIANDGTVRNVKINGQVQRWKTRPDEVSVPVKYGMYEYARFDTAEALRRFVVVVS